MNKNYINIFSLALVSLSITSFHTDLLGMASSSSHSRPLREYVDLKDKLAHDWAGPDLQYYKEYHAHRVNNDTVSFPLDSCDPLPVQTFDNLKYFFTSAIESNTSCLRYNGEPLQISEPTVDKIIAVRGKGSAGTWAHIYAGYNSNNFKLIKNKKIFEAKLLYLWCKDTRNPQRQSVHYPLESLVKHFGNTEIALAIRPHLSDSKNYNWRDPEFQKIFRENFLKSNGINDLYSQNGQDLLSRTCYWTKEENKLKGIKYSSSNR